MLLSINEEKVLRKIAERSILTRPELRRILREDGGEGIDLDVVVKNLVAKQCVSTISPLGLTSYIITRTGTRLLEELG